METSNKGDNGKDLEIIKGKCEVAAAEPSSAETVVQTTAHSMLENINKGVKPRVIDIGSWNEDQLLGKIQEYIFHMTKFATNTKNVHRELKDTLGKTGTLLKQYAKVKANCIGNRPES